MIRQLEGNRPTAEGAYALVVSRYNNLVTKKLLDGAIDTLHRHGVKDDHITVAWVPGAFEIPLAADRLAATGRFAAVCCLGAVIQGATSHHEYINQQVAAGLMNAGLKYGIPVTFGVLTCGTMEQALERAGGIMGNKGDEAVLAAIEMVNLLRTLSESGGK
ncbi:MAG: 6,7-dimethyl-8-ribityllumazine synthase [Planctomycetota bacterium]|nr:6,7-dimethyl-8-ribityllumazine synthase [Planctomycetota bacterium]MDA1210899.1 6,7-dimethyl-8-ribityllumazine synthase [Planctomycetota bacterium]